MASKLGIFQGCGCAASHGLLEVRRKRGVSSTPANNVR